MLSSKTCFKCNAHLPISEFYPHPEMADGHLNKCKECAKKDANMHRLKNIEKIRLYDRERAKNPERMKACAEIRKAWVASDKRIMKCHNAVARAVRSGSLTREPCIICGSEKSIAHHESYNHPLSVVWYCQPHHSARHKQMVMLGIDPFKEES